MAYDKHKYDQAKTPTKPGAPKRPRKPRPVAVVMCNGGCDLQGCKQGCIGCATCVGVCRKNAIHINERGVAVVDRDACIGCGLCVRSCEQKVIQLVEREFTITARCSNTEKGSDAKLECDNSCIACGACERACPSGAIHVVDNRAVIDWAHCIACGMCATKCPRNVIRDAFGIVAEK